jgi:hypothetical protein
LPELQPREVSDPGEQDSTKDQIATGYSCACPEIAFLNMKSPCLVTAALP